jgi:hypothetical protein
MSVDVCRQKESGMFGMKNFGAAVAAASMVMVLGAGSASAANWDPANTTLTAHGTLTLKALPSGGTVTCTYHSGVRSTGNDIAFTTETGGVAAAPPTFSNCTTTIVGVTLITTTADQAWALTATSTTTVDVSNGNATLTLFAGTPPNQVDVCTIKAASVSLDAAWNPANTSLTPNDATFTISETGAACPGDTSGTMTGSVTVPGLSIT